MESAASGVDTVRLYLQKRIDECTTRITRAKKAAAAATSPHGAQRRRPGAETDVAVRRAYRDALRALEAVPPDAGAVTALRLAAVEVNRVKSAVALIYEVAQHASHDILDRRDWAIVEGEAQAALNVLREAARGG